MGYIVGFRGTYWVSVICIRPSGYAGRLTQRSSMQLSGRRSDCAPSLRLRWLILERVMQDLGGV